MRRKGRITKIERENVTISGITHGIKKEEQKYYDNSSRYHGSNGTYAHNFQTEPHIYMYVTMYENDEYESERIKIDIRDSILSQNGLERVSAKRLEDIQKNNVNKKVSFDWNPDTGSVTFDSNNLII